MANVKLSKEESELVMNAELILTKNRVIQKVFHLFGDLSDRYLQLSHSLPGEVIAIHPKISKGENYQGLPWVMLDYPRAFSNTDVLAVRSFFWWGNHFSITLQLQGKYKARYQQAIVAYLKEGPADWWIGTGDDPWQHHFESDNYIAYHPELNVQELPFIKMAKKIPLQQWDNSPDLFCETYRQFMRLLSAEPVE